MSWSGVNGKYRCYTPWSLAAVRRAELDQNSITEGVVTESDVRQPQLIDLRRRDRPTLPSYSSPAMSGAFLWGMILGLLGTHRRASCAS